MTDPELDVDEVLVRPSGTLGRDTFHLPGEDGAPICGMPLHIHDEWRPEPLDSSLVARLDLCDRCNPESPIDRKELAENGSTLSETLADPNTSPEDIGLSPMRADGGRDGPRAACSDEGGRAR